MLTDIVFPEFDELRPYTGPLEGGINRQGTGIPDSISGFLAGMAGLSGSGIHGQPVVNPFPVSGTIDFQPSVEDITQVRRLMVRRGIELCHGGQFTVLAGDKIRGTAEIGFVFPPDDGELNAVAFFFLREPVREIFVLIESSRRELRRLAEFAALHLSEFQCHSFV